MNNEISGKSFSSVIISDTPIVSIAGSTLSEITTTTTSTTTTPTPTSFELIKSKAVDNRVASKNPMSDAAAVKSGAGAGAKGNAAIGTTDAAASVVQPGAVAKSDITSQQQTQATGKAEETSSETKSKKSEVLEDTRIEKLPEPDLKKLLDEAYSYKCPKDKKDKSDIFLSLLQKAENEEKAQYNSLASNTFNSHRHHHHPHHHHHLKQGGSLQNLVELHSEYSEYTLGLTGCLRNRRQNHTSRQKKYSSVSSRQREGGSLPSSLSSNVNMANCLNVNSFDKQQLRPHGTKIAGSDGQAICVSSAINSGNSNSNGNNNVNCNDNNSTRTTTVGAASSSATVCGGGAAAGAKNANRAAGDCIIHIDEMMDIQQQHQILNSKAHCSAYYDHVDTDMRIPRPNILRGGEHAVTSKTDFAPTTSHHYVDEGVRFEQMDRVNIMPANSTIITAALDPALGIGASALKSIPSSSIPMPLNEHYKSCKSVMGEKGERVVTAKLVASTSSGGGGSSSGSSSSSYGKSLPRQLDENGNSLSEFTAQVERSHNSSSISSVSITASASIVNTSQTQAKLKGKKKSQKDNTTTVQYDTVAGYRGRDPVEELVKYIESSEDNNNKQGGSASSGKFGENSKKKERKKDKEKQNKMKKSNSLEELRSCAKIVVDDLKRSAATTESNNVTMRSKGAAGSKNSKNNSASAADINKNFESGCGSGKDITTSSIPTGQKQDALGAGANRKGERRSWGTEELQYLGENHNNNSAAGGSNEKTGKEKKSKNKEKEKEKEKEKDKEKEKEKEKEAEKEKDKDKDKDNEKEKEKDKEKEKEKEKEKSEKLVNNTDNAEGEISMEFLLKREKCEKPEKSEKRKKGDSNVQPTNTRAISDGLQVIDIDFMEVDSLLPESAEFHVVTKKKKPKKQRISVDFNRTPNFILNTPKSNSAFGPHQQPQQQQQQQRYKSLTNNFSIYSLSGSSNSGNGERMENHTMVQQNHQQQQSSQQQLQQPQQLQTQQHHHNQQQHVAAGNNGTGSGSGNSNSGSGDKLRRKSTSSVPPSEQSDSSDVDSVHSLPIESTTKSKSQRHKDTSSASAVAAVAGNGSPAPISYADIAAAAAVDHWPALDTANNNANTSILSSNGSNTANNSVCAELSPANQSMDSNRSTGSVTQASTVNMSGSKQVKTKKLTTKPDFPELVATMPTTAVVVASTDVAIGKATTNATKLISYSQSLSTVPTSANAIISRSTGSEVSQSVTTTNTIPGIEQKESKVEKRNITTEMTKMETTSATGNFNGTRPLQQHQQQQSQPQQHSQHTHSQQQPLQKSKSVEHDSYSFNSSNLDQQYPALEKTVKRHSATNVAMVTAPTIGTMVASNPGSASSTQFNFAAAAKQQINVSMAPKAIAAVTTLPATPQTATTTTSNNNYTVTTAATAVAATTTTATTNTSRKLKEKSPMATATVGVTRIMQQSPVAYAVDIGNVARKNKKEKPQQQMPVVEATLTTAAYVAAPTSEPAVTRKSTTATQTTSISSNNYKQPRAQTVTGTGTTTATVNSNVILVSVGSNSTHPNIKVARIASGSNKNQKPLANSNNPSNAKYYAGGSGVTTAASMATCANRPAVIIMNDDRSDSNLDIGIEFTFGDFNEDELRFLDERIDKEAVENDVVPCSDEPTTVVNLESPPPPSVETSKSSPVTTGTSTEVVYFDDTSALQDAHNVNNLTPYTESLVLFSNAKASSPNSSYVAGASICGNDSGIYVSTGNSQQSIQSGNSQQEHLTPPPTQTTQLNSLLSNSGNETNNCNSSTVNAEQQSTGATYNSSNMADSSCNNSNSYPMPQQLETCNAIETVIIAAARAAAEQQQQQQQHTQLPPQPQQQQQQHRQQYQNSNSFSKSSSFSSSSSVSMDKHHHQQYHMHQQQQQHQQQYQQTPTGHNTYVERSRSNSSNSNSNAHELSPTPSPVTSPPATRTPPTGSVVVSIQRKEFNFIPPAISALSSLQHNDIIVDFIGSSWEEVAKRTKFYDGQ